MNFNTITNIRFTVNCHLVKCVEDIDCPLRGNNETRQRTVARYLTNLSKMFYRLAMGWGTKITLYVPPHRKSK